MSQQQPMPGQALDDRQPQAEKNPELSQTPPPAYDQDKELQPQAGEAPVQPGSRNGSISYPKVENEEANSAIGIPANERERQGTKEMGTPAEPSSHPDNQEAASWHARGSDNTGRNGGARNEGTIQEGTNDAGSRIPGNSNGPSSARHTPDSPYVQQPDIIPSSPNAQASEATGSRVAPGSPGKSPMDNIVEALNKLGKKAEGVTGNVWSHLKTGPNMADTAWGRLSLGTKALQEGGLVNVFKHTFPASANEQLLDSFACYLSTTTGPVAGTLYISTEKFAFCSDRPLSSTPRPGGEQSWSYFKVIIPVDKVQAVNPSESEKKPTEKYVQILTNDQHEFWFMGFVSYDKGVRSLQEAVSTSPRNVNGQANVNPPNTV